MESIIAPRIFSKWLYSSISFLIFFFTLDIGSNSGTIFLLLMCCCDILATSGLKTIYTENVRPVFEYGSNPRSTTKSTKSTSERNQCAQPYCKLPHQHSWDIKASFNTFSFFVTMQLLLQPWKTCFSLLFPFLLC